MKDAIFDARCIVARSAAYAAKRVVQDDLVYAVALRDAHKATHPYDLEGYCELNARVEQLMELCSRAFEAESEVLSIIGYGWEWRRRRRPVVAVQLEIPFAPGGAE